MKSPNPHSGIYEADTARTLDLNGGSPACNQGGIAVVQKREPVVLESNQVHATVTQSGVAPTLPAAMGMGGGYVPMVTAVDCRNGTENPDVNGTLQAKANGGISVNLQNVVRVEKHD